MRLVAGTAAHEVNNLAQGLLNLLALASEPTVTRDALARYASLARDGLAELRRLGADLRALADSQTDPRSERLDLVCEDVLDQGRPSAGRIVERGEWRSDVFVRGSSAALRLAISSLLEHALAASPPSSAIRIAVSSQAGGGAVVVDASGAQRPATAETPVADLLAGPAHELSSAPRLVFAGAVAAEYGGKLTVRPGAVSGLRFELTFPG